MSRAAVSCDDLPRHVVALRDELGVTALRRLETLHDLEHDLLEVALPLGQRGDLVLEALQLLGRGHLTGVEALLVALRPRPDLVDVALGLAELAGEVALLGLDPDQLVAQHRRAGLQVGQRRVLRQRRPAVGELVDAGVEGLHVEQSLLVGGGGNQRGLLASVVHGSVTVVLTRVSTVSARAPSRSSSSRSA